MACANDNCDREARPGQLACRGCWFSLPKPLRDGIWSTYRSNDRPGYAANVREARRLWNDAAQRNSPTPEDTPDAS